ncbi:HCP-like protein [Gonapodya prolifera JEL478]|uniref:HCP-like protein n=1 Tax=Gonapodya prolifera (strain JEL478) TaxID=1344416 RepID=A0A139AHE2_GONPJ|nr:HCP-like protein [Gonapodya prolifera JEL478]|eukprot:KXS16226.1 HCP-like protein [Gonapodya prolifera JEL478]
MADLDDRTTTPSNSTTSPTSPPPSPQHTTSPLPLLHHPISVSNPNPSPPPLSFTTTLAAPTTFAGILQNTQMQQPITADSISRPPIPPNLPSTHSRLLSKDKGRASNSPNQPFDPIRFRRLQEARALPYYVRAAKLGNAHAVAVLGFYWEHGLATLPISFAVAEQYYTAAALAGASLAQARLSFLKMYGRPAININQADARQWRKRLARKGKRALGWLKTGADSGIPASQFCLASCFYNGIGTKKDDRRAFIWAGRAATQGHPGAQNLLGMLYVDGIGDDVPKDPITGLRWYMRSSEQGDPAAIYNIATLFERGLAIQEDMQEAFDWYMRAAAYGSISAANIIGLFYEQEQELAQVEARHQLAYQWYARAAHQGHPFAQYNLGRCYSEGIGCDRSHGQALHWFELAAQQRHVLARVSLGIMYEEGFGAHVDRSRALEWFRRAAYRGSREARSRLRPVWACRVLSASRNLLASETRPQKGFEGRTGLWSLPVELKEQIVSWLNAENILERDEMKRAVAIGRDKSSLTRGIAADDAGASQMASGSGSLSDDQVDEDGMYDIGRAFDENEMDVSESGDTDITVLEDEDSDNSTLMEVDVVEVSEIIVVTQTESAPLSSVVPHPPATVAPPIDHLAASGFLIELAAAGPLKRTDFLGHVGIRPFAESCECVELVRSAARREAEEVAEQQGWPRDEAERMSQGAVEEAVRGFRCMVLKHRIERYQERRG